MISRLLPVKKRFFLNARWKGTLIVGVALSGCASTYKPEDLRVPTSITCIYLPTPMSFYEKRGASSEPWETRLERGPYVAEREDDEGTFYRAPPGGFSGWPYSRPATQSNARDGGFWIPRNPKTTPRLYSYFSTSAVPPVVPADNVDCSSFGQVKDPVTSKVSLIALASGGALGGAAGGLAGRSMNSQGGLSYGQAAGVGAVGGAVGMLIVGAMINADVGKIVLYPWEESSDIDKLRNLASQAVKVKELSKADAPSNDSASVNANR